MRALIVLIVLLFSAAAQAGDAGCETTRIEVADLDKAMRAAQEVHAFLDASDAEVAVIARIGSDQSERGIRYTHAGLILRSHPEGPWTISHLLRDCETPRSDIYHDGLVNFYLEKPFSYHTLIVVPTKELQARLAEELFGPLVRGLHESRYNTLANPFRDQFQNSNQWVLELIAAAQRPLGSITTRREVQGWLEANGYIPATMRLNAAERIAVRSGMKTHVSLDDHSSSERRRGYSWVSVRSIVDYLERSAQLAFQQELPMH